MRLALALTLLATPLAAEPPLTAAEFEAHVGTDTITYTYNSGDIGTADYGPDRSLRWAFQGRDCVTATWYQHGDELCFAFDYAELNRCWHFHLDEGRLTATSTNLPETLVITEIARTKAPLACSGPQVGV